MLRPDIATIKALSQMLALQLFACPVRWVCASAEVGHVTKTLSRPQEGRGRDAGVQHTLRSGRAVAVGQPLDCNGSCRCETVQEVPVYLASCCASVPLKIACHASIPTTLLSGRESTPLSLLAFAIATRPGLAVHSLT